MRYYFVLFVLFLCFGCPLYTLTAQETDKPAQKSIELFAGQTLEDWGWNATNFGGEGDVNIVNDEIIMESGGPMTGIHRNRDEELPTTDYEITLEAKRLEGIDFFCALTFPVDESHCTFVVAGWAGSTVGLSCVDGLDASSNDTTKLMTFEDNRWYQIKVRVTQEHISCWIDKEKVVHQKLEGHEISVRGDISASRPFGLTAFESKVAYRNIRLTPIKPQVNKENQGN